MLLQTGPVSTPVPLFVPRVSGNHIFQGQAAGIAVNENGRGVITGVEASRTRGALFSHLVVATRKKSIATTFQRTSSERTSGGAWTSAEEGTPS